jgi:hypothetical protein
MGPRTGKDVVETGEIFPLPALELLILGRATRRQQLYQLKSKIVTMAGQRRSQELLNMTRGFATHYTAMFCGAPKHFSRL